MGAGRRKPVIALDGPAGAGKSTVSKAVADRLGFTYIDTGAMYRAVALLAHRAGLSVEEPDAVADLAARTEFSFERDDRGQSRIHVNGEDVEDAVRTPEIGRLSSPVSAIPGVRHALVARQREMGADGGIVMEGRDIQTVVFPDAELKVFLTASEEERARRRQSDLAARGIERDLEAILADMRERDTRDSSRAVAPLSKAEDAVGVDTDGLSFEEVVEAVARLARERMGG